MKDFFDGFSQPIKCKDKIDEGHDKKYFKILKPVTSAFLTRLKNTKSILETVTYNSLPGVIPLKGSSVVKLLIYKEFIDSTINLLIGVDDEEKRNETLQNVKNSIDTLTTENDEEKTEAYSCYFATIKID